MRDQKLHKVASGPGNDGLTAIQYKDQRRKVPCTLRDFFSLGIHKTECKVGGPGRGHPVALDQVEPLERRLNNNWSGHMDLSRTQVNPRHVVHHDSAHVIQRHPVEENIGTGEIRLLSSGSTATQKSPMRLPHGLWFACAPRGK